MSPSATRTTPAARRPTLEGDFLLPEEFALECGGVLRGARLRYVLYGEINAARDNVALVAHALSGSAHVAEWWPAIWNLPGLIDIQSDAQSDAQSDVVPDAILGVNILGSCYGSTGPTSLDPETGKPYGAGFPLVTIRDTVRAQALLLDWLGVAALKLAIGGSIGGMQALEWAILFPERVRRAVVVGVAPLGALGLGLNHLQRQVIRLDPEWQGGSYPPGSGPTQGLALARSLAVCSYKSPELLDERYGRRPNRNGEDPWADPLLSSLQVPLPSVPSPSVPSPSVPSPQPFGGRFDIAGYLDYQGEKFLARFDANAYIAITRLMDLFDPTRGYPSPTAAYSRIQAEVTLVGISSDGLFPPADVRAMARAIQAAGASCEYRELVSSHGHDAFLAEPELLVKALSR